MRKAIAAAVLGCTILTSNVVLAQTPAPAGASVPSAVADAPAPMPVQRPRNLGKMIQEWFQPAAQAAPASPAAAAGPAAPQQPQRLAIPDDYKIAMLIRTSLIALNQANITGNYSVLRDLGAPSFQQSNTAARLAELFANLRMRQIDLEPVLVIDPKVVQPYINERGMLRIKGFFPTAPEQVNFELAFEQDGRVWKLFAIGVTTSLAVAQNPPPAPPPAQ